VSYRLKIIKNQQTDSDVRDKGWKCWAGRVLTLVKIHFTSGKKTLL